jgi:transposase
MTLDDLERRNAAMVQAAKNGATYSQIAESVGLSLSWAGQVLRSNGAPLPEHGKGVKRHLDYLECRAAYEAGATVRDLADAAGVSYSAMYRGLAQVGTPFRPRGRPGGR